MCYSTMTKVAGKLKPTVLLAERHANLHLQWNISVLDLHQAPSGGGCSTDRLQIDVILQVRQWAGVGLQF